MRSWGLAVLATLALAAAGVGAWWVLVAQPQARQQAAADTVEAYLAAWENRDWPALAARVHGAPQAAVDGHRALVEDLAVEALRAEPTALQIAEESARADVAVTVDLAGLDPWRYETHLELAWADDLWEVVWSPAVVHPEFVEGGAFSRSRSWGPRGAILDREGSPLVGGAERVTVGIEPQRVNDAAEVVDALATHAGASRDEVEALLARDDLQPDWFYPVVDLPRERFDEVDPQLRPVPGVLFRAGEGRSGLSGGFALHVLGRTEELTPEQAEEHGRGYEPGDVAGVFGLERARDEDLAGRPETTIIIVDADGEEVSVVHRLEGVEASDVHTTLDRRIQSAAEEALGAVTNPAGLVAVDVATMEIRAAASRPLEGFNRAMAGRYPPGSTFKVVTTAALLGQGMTAESALECPAERSVGGRSFRNASGFALGATDLREAFARSCNTAYVGTVADNEDDLAAAARAFGFDGTAHDVGVNAFGGEYPEPSDLVELAAAAIGQGRVEASPLHMATVAGAAASGEWRPATLFQDGAERSARAIPGDAAVLGALMRDVVTAGTGTAAQVGGEPVAGKTGTAEFGSGDDLGMHAWFIGFRGPVAFAVFVEGGGAGGEVAAPIAARFLRALDG